jgi:hypothetical protein
MKRLYTHTHTHIYIYFDSHKASELDRSAAYINCHSQRSESRTKTRHKFPALRDPVQLLWCAIWRCHCVYKSLTVLSCIELPKESVTSSKTFSYSNHKNKENYIMRSLMVLLLTKYCSGDQIEKNEMREACSTYGGAHMVLLGILRKGPLRRPGRRWEDNIKMDIL